MPGATMVMPAASVVLVRHLCVAGTRRSFAHEANDCVVLLAILATNEGNEATAIELVLHAGVCSGWASVLADELALVLGVAEERRRSVLEEITSAGRTAAIERAERALNGEVLRRGWIADATVPISA